jgi:cobalt-zinc-cadmium efflux system outer membrane protein
LPLLCQLWCRWLRPYELRHFFCLSIFALALAQPARAAGGPTSLQPYGGSTTSMQPIPMLPPAGQGGAPLPLNGQITIEQALDQTLLTGPRAAAARSMLGVSQAGLVQARILPNPALEFDNGYAELSYRFGVAIPLEPPWKMVFRVAAARAQIGAATIQMAQSLWLLRADVRRAYAELVVAQESQTMMRELAQLTGRLAEVARKRYKAGEVPKLDMFKADLAAAQADVDAEQEDRRVVQAREQLNIVMGRPETAELSVPSLAPFKLYAGQANSLLPDLSKPLAPLSGYVNSALNSRLELKLVKQQIVANTANRKLTVGNIVPNGQISTGWDRQRNPPDQVVNRMYLMGSFPVPILDRQQGELARLRATARNLNFDLISQQNLIRGQVDLAYRKVVNAREIMRRYQQGIIAQSQQVAELGRLSYELGQANITSALSAQQANIQVRNAYLVQVMNYEQGFTDLEQAVGHVLQ